MQSQKAHKIDLTAEYPCPCRRRGQLTPIALTEAFGCNRCQQIFVVQDSGYVIEQLSTTYPYKQSWRWTGHQWVRTPSSLGKGYFPITITLIAIFVLVLIATQSPASSGLILWAIGGFMVILLFMLWLGYRR